MTVEPIAVVGIGCRFPGARGIDGFWQLLIDGADLMREVPSDRFDINRFHDSRPKTPGRVTARLGGFLDDIDLFDAGYFRISPKEAAQLDPQHRLLLETTAEALHNAGLTREWLAQHRAGVFSGQSTRNYWDLLATRGVFDSYSSAGAMGSGSSGRLSHAFDLRGPSMTIDTACSSSLVAVHLAVRSLRSAECDVAVAAGVNLILGPSDSIAYSQVGMLSPDGRCKFGAASADGFVRSEAAATVVLKPYSRAVADGDPVQAVILGSAARNDGGAGAGASMMTPSDIGQIVTLRAAYADANVDPAEVRYVEAHGTGTPVGDPVEFRSIAEVIGVRHSVEHPVAVGSVKSNIGHSEAAAGIAGLIKTVLAVRNRYIPASLHAEELTKAIDWASVPVEVARTARPWPTTERAVAGVCSTGISGTNAHVVVAQAPPRQARSRAAATEAPRLLTISARSRTALQTLAQSYEDLLAADRVPVADICHTASARRDHDEHRLTAVGSTAAELAGRLRAFAAGTQAKGLAHAENVPGTAPQVVFVFPGQGSQWVGMARELIRTAPAFAATLAECDAAVRAEAGWSVIERLTTDTELSAVDWPVNIVQPVLWAVEVALAAQWTAWGVRPDVVVGHSMGEAAAACVAGALTLADGAAVICRRSALVAKVSGEGGMASVELTVEQAEAEIAPYADRVSVAVSNSAGSTVIAGDPDALDEIIASLTEREIFCRRVNVDYASHSPQMDALRADLLSALEDVRPRANTVRMVSTVDCADVAGTDLTTEYWVRNLREPVMFGPVTRGLAEAAPSVFVEISPHPILVPALQETVDDVGSGSVVSSTRRDEPELTTLLAAAGQVHLTGVRLNWAAMNPGNHVDLPAYPWQRVRHWFAERTPEVSTHPLLAGFTKVAHGQWVGNIDLAANAYLRDHQVQNVPVLPGAAYVEMVLAAVDGATELRDVTFHSAIYLDTAPTVRLDVAGDHVTISSRVAGAPDWVTNATGTVGFRAAPDSPTASGYLRGVVRAQLAGEAFYERFASEGNQWLGAFRGITRLWCGAGEATAHITAPASIATTVPAHTFHPALLDACFQVLIGAIDPDELNSSLVLGGFDSISVYASPGDATILRCRAALTERPGSFAGDLTVTDEDGNVLAEVRGLWSRPLEQPVAAELAVEELLYEVRWESAAEPVADPRPGYWLVFADAGGLGADLAAGLGPEVAMVTRGMGFRTLGQGRYEVDPDSPADYHAVVAAARGEFGALPCAGVVHLWSLDTHGPLDTSAGRSIPSLVAALTEPVDLWLVTRGAQRLAGDQVAAPAQSLVWGLGRSLAVERLDLRTVLVDLPEGTSTAVSLTRELTARDVSENQIALRATGRYVARLARGVPRNAPAGLEPGSGEVAIDIDHAVVDGVEYVGRIAAVGAGVAGLSVGDAVVALAAGPVADARLVFPAPAGVTAATFGGYLTAYLALHEYGRLTAGKRVLVHAVTGAAGLAAIQYAKAQGAEVYATAGSEEQRAMLRMLGLRYVGDSAACADEILAETRGRGVEIVFNTGGEIEQSLRTLAPGGRYVGAAGGQAGLASVDLPYLIAERPDDTAAAMRHVLGLLGSGQLPPVPGETRAVAATRGFEIRPDAAYLVTGGLGGLGSFACDWLLASGARHVVALGRSPLTKQLDSRITYHQVDVADEAGLRAILRQREAAGLPPVRGVLHTAGVIEFAAFDEYTPRHLDTVLNPKVAGGWALHRATIDEPLDFFVLYSSGTAVFGSPHTSAYAAGNAYLDGLAHLRRGAGLPATSVNWGYWTDAGMVVRLEADHGRKFVPEGVAGFGPEVGMPALRELLERDAVQATVVVADWPRWAAAEPAMARNPLLRDLVGTVAPAPASAVIPKPVEPVAPSPVSFDDVAALLVEAVSSVLGMSAQDLDLSAPLNRMGFDSLMAGQVRTRIQDATGVQLPITRMLSGKSVTELASGLRAELDSVGSAE